MRLRSLRVRNFRRFRDATLELPDGLIALVGPNGAGKSTLLEAVGWCLYGHEAARTEKTLLKHSRAAAGEDVEVQIEFELDGAAHRVVRRLRGKSQQSDAQVEVDGVLVVAPGANSAEAATHYVTERLGMDRRGFVATVFARQGDLRALGDAQPGERKRILLGLLGIEALDAAIVRARLEKREAAVRLEELRRLLAREPELRERLAGASADLERTEAAHVGAVAESEALVGQVASLHDATQRWAAARQRHRDLRARLEGLQRALQAREEQRTRLAAELRLLDERHQELDRTRAEGAPYEGLDARLLALGRWRTVRDARSALDRETQRLHAERARWETVLGANGHAEGELPRAEREGLRLRGAVEAATARRAGLENHLRHRESERRRLQQEATAEAERSRDRRDLGPDAPCPVCERPLGASAARVAARARDQEEDRRASLVAAERDLTTVRLELEGIARERERLDRSLAETERRVTELRQHREQVRLASQERDGIATRLLELARSATAVPAWDGPVPDAEALERDRAERERWRHRVARLEAELERRGPVRTEFTIAHQQVEETRHEIEAASRDLADLAYPEGAGESAQRAEEEARGRLHAAERRRDVLAERRAGLADQCHQTREDLAQFAVWRADATALEDRTRIGELLAADRGDRGLLPEFRTHLISRVRPALAHAASQLVRDMTSARYTELALDDDYGVRLFDGAQAWPLARFSGGESDVVHLALRLAVGELLGRTRRAHRLEFVALDEVLAGQDEERRRDVLGALKRLGPHFRQVLLVTHLEEVRDRVDHVVHVAPLDDGTSVLRTSWTDKV